MDYSEDMQKRHEYFKALEEERRKIETFQRDLPLCLHLVTQAIETYKQQLSGTTTDCTLNGESDCSEQTTSGDEGVVFEGFIPIKRSCSSLQEVQEQEKEDDDDDGHELESNINDKFKKSDWLRSVQLWSQSPDPPTTTNNKENKSEQPRKVLVVEVRRNGGAFHPFKKEMSANCDGVHVSGNTSTAPSLCSTPKRVATRKNEGGKEGGRGEARKARRCWSPELHRRFIHALQQLGGPHVATPKQIRDLMNVDGLTNDEVKSHLQKYRLHSRRPTLSLHNSASTQPPHFVVVGGIWVPPPEYAATGTILTQQQTTTTVNVVPPIGIYPPLAAPLQPYHRANSIHSQKHKPSRQSGSPGKGGGGSGGARCNTQASSSSTRTTTTA